MNGLTDTRALRQLAGADDPRIENLHECVRALSSRIGTWRALPARPQAIADAVVQADAIARGLRELQSALAAEVADAS